MIAPASAISTRLDAILFDLDGTLVDTYTLHERAYRSAFDRLGLDFAADNYRRGFGLRIDQALPLMLGRDPDDRERSLIPKLKAAALDESIASGIETLPLAGLLQLLKGSLPLALVTAASSRTVEIVLNHLAWADVFKVIVCGEDVVQSKPDPAPYLEALARLNVRPQRCLAFEDSLIGFTSATAAGIPTLLVSAQADRLGE
jgi:beta-phosphoglucomutase-like phosphatase (HAD superfamily)